MMPVTILQLNT